MSYWWHMMPWQLNLTFVPYAAITWTFFILFFFLHFLLSRFLVLSVHDVTCMIQKAQVCYGQSISSTERVYFWACVSRVCVCVCMCVWVCVRALNSSSFPVRGVAQSGVWGRHGCTVAYDWQPHYTTCTEPVREQEGRNRLIIIIVIVELGFMVHFR